MKKHKRAYLQTWNLLCASAQRQVDLRDRDEIWNDLSIRIWIFSSQLVYEVKRTHMKHRQLSASWLELRAWNDIWLSIELHTRTELLLLCYRTKNAEWLCHSLRRVLKW